MDSARSRSRRALLFVHAAPVPHVVVLRPPWAKSEADFAAACTRCDACVRACPPQVLVRDADGVPRFDAQTGECTFCGECAAFPCRRLRQLDLRYRTKYGMSMLANLEAIRTFGIRKFVALQELIR